MDYDTKIIKEIGSMWAAIGKKVGLLSIADPFSPITRYTSGRIVVYDCGIFQCTSEHYGDWDEGHFRRTTVEASCALPS